MPQATGLDTSGGSQQHLQHKKFVIFFDNKTEATDAGSYLLLMDECNRVIWFMANVSAGFKQDGIANLTSGKLLGICATDSFGMASASISMLEYCMTYLQGIDLKDIDLVIQWKVTCDPCMLWQRFGYRAHDKDVQATALLFVESKDLDSVDPTDGHKQKAPEDGGKTEPKSKQARKDRPVPMALDVDAGAAGEDEFWKARKEVYHELISEERKLEINPVLDDVINTETQGIGCWWKPFRAYFDDKHCGSSNLSSCSVLNSVLKGSMGVTMPLIDLVLIAHHIYLTSAVISVIQKSLRACSRFQIHHQNPNYTNQK